MHSDGKIKTKNFLPQNAALATTAVAYDVSRSVNFVMPVSPTPIVLVQTGLTL